jgi:hypothetical protein
MSKSERLLGAALLGVIAVFVLFMLFTLQGPAQAAPPAAPTPVADFLVQGGQAHAFNFQTRTAITGATNTTGVEVIGLGAVDIQYVIDQATATNTLTLTTQYSNDNTNWVSGVALVSSNSADATDITRIPVFGRYMRIAETVTGSNPVTVTVTAVGR